MDPVYTILLKRDRKRREHVFGVLQKQLSRPIHIFPAVDGPALDANKIKEFIYEKYIYFDRLHKLNSGQVGIALSVILLLEKMVSEGISDICVLEDDATLCEGFEQIYDRICGELPSDYDFLYLFKHPYYYQPDHPRYQKPPKPFLEYINSHTSLRFGDPDIQIPGKELIEKSPPVCGIVGFRASLKGAKKILKSVKPIYFPIDDMIMHMVLKGVLNAYSVKSGIVDTAGSISAWDLSNRKLRSNVWGTFGYSVAPPNQQRL